jgi:selenide, water dikinase
LQRARFRLHAGIARRFAEFAEHSQRADFMADAAPVELGVRQTTALTIDFITPIAPRLEDYGHMAAANALSDVYAVGHVPRFALAVSRVPQGPATEEFLIAFEAAAACLAEAGCVLVGGHSVVDPEPKLGFAVVGTPNRTGRDLSTGARPGGVLILTKPLGVGLLTSAYRAGLIARRARARCQSMTGHHHSSASAVVAPGACPAGRRVAHGASGDLATYSVH